MTALTDKKPKKGWVYISPLEFIWENIHRFNVQEKPDHLDISRFVHGVFFGVFFEILILGDILWFHFDSMTLCKDQLYFCFF